MEKWKESSGWYSPLGNIVRARVISVGLGWGRGRLVFAVSVSAERLPVGVSAHAGELTLVKRRLPWADRGKEYPERGIAPAPVLGSGGNFP